MNIKIILVIIAVVLVIALIAGILYYQGLRIKISFEAPKSSEKPEEQLTAERDMEEMEEAYKLQFPDTIEGIINIVSEEETTVMTIKDGRKYLVSPARSLDFYRDSGIKDNDLVRVQCKILEDNKLTLGSVVPVK